MRVAARGNGGVSFLPLECWNPMVKVATFAAELDKKRISCRVSLEVLRTCFRGSEEKPMEIVAEKNTRGIRDRGGHVGYHCARIVKAHELLPVVGVIGDVGARKVTHHQHQPERVKSAFLGQGRNLSDIQAESVHARVDV